MAIETLYDENLQRGALLDLCTGRILPTYSFRTRDEAEDFLHYATTFAGRSPATLRPETLHSLWHGWQAERQARCADDMAPDTIRSPQSFEVTL